MGVSVWTCECAAKLKLIHDELDEEEKGYEYRMMNDWYKGNKNNNGIIEITRDAPGLRIRYKHTIKALVWNKNIIIISPLLNVVHDFFLVFCIPNRPHVHSSPSSAVSFITLKRYP